MICNCNRCRFGLIVIAWYDNSHTRKHLHKSNIFQDLMGCPIFSQCYTSVRRADLYIFTGIGYRLAYLVINAAGREVRKCCCEGNFTTYCKASGNADHVGFCDTYLYKPFRKFFNKLVQLQGSCKVGGKCYNVGIFSCCFYNTVTKTTTCVFLPCRLNFF